MNRGGSARSVETVILAALVSRNRLWIRYGCQATTGTNSTNVEMTAYGTWASGTAEGWSETAARADCQRKTETESVMRLEADLLRYLRERQAESGD